ncbi:MAG TPA: hypothetical protein VK145_01335 [Candidatus Nanoarchaeia archaeon]|nr:hypothetical protein [Candidatus Nanoarchaeia archaeon]
MIHLKFLKESRAKILIAVILLIGVVSSFGFFKYSRAQLGLLPFGGLVVNSFICECSGNFLLTVAGPAGGQFVYYPGTQAYESFNLGPESGMFVLGLYEPFGVCSAYDGECYTVPGVRGTISPTVGSSLTF